MAHLVRMPRAAWRRQPQGPVDLDYANPLTNNIFYYFCYADRRVYDYVKRYNGSTTNTSFLAGVSGIFARQTNRNLLSGFSPISLSANQDFTMLFSGNPTSSSTRECLVSQRQGGFIHDVELRTNCAVDGSAASGGRIWFLRSNKGGPVGSNYCSSSTGVDGAAHQFVATCKGLSFNIFIDGVNRTDNSNVVSSDIISPTASLCLGGLSDSTVIPYSGDRFVDAAWGRALIPAEIKSLSENPWQLFRPRPSRFILIPSAGVAVPSLSSPFFTNRVPRVTITY